MATLPSPYLAKLSSSANFEYICLYIHLSIHSFLYLCVIYQEFSISQTLFFFPQLFFPNGERKETNPYELVILHI